MTVGRENLLSINGLRLKQGERILLVEDSVALSTLLTQRLEDETGATVTRCGSLSAARKNIAEGTFLLALTGLNLPDAPNGEILDMLLQEEIPTIVFTAMFDADTRERCTRKKIVDYIVKDGTKTVDKVVRAVSLPTAPIRYLLSMTPAPPVRNLSKFSIARISAFWKRVQGGRHLKF